MTQEPRTKLEKIVILAFDILVPTATIFIIAFILFIINGCTPREVMIDKPESLQQQMDNFSKKWNADNKARYEACKKKKGLPILDYETGKWECLTDLEQIKIKNK